LRNFAEFENSLAISTILDLMTYFLSRKNLTELLKAVNTRFVNQCNMTWQIALLKCRNWQKFLW